MSGVSIRGLKKGRLYVCWVSVRGSKKCRSYVCGVSVRGSKCCFFQFYGSMKIYFHRIMNIKINIVNWEWRYLFLPYNFFIAT
jgi:hypothetical protein